MDQALIWNSGDQCCRNIDVMLNIFEEASITVSPDVGLSKDTDVKFGTSGDFKSGFVQFTRGEHVLVVELFETVPFDKEWCVLEEANVYVLQNRNLEAQVDVEMFIRHEDYPDDINRNKIQEEIPIPWDRLKVFM